MESVGKRLGGNRLGIDCDDVSNRSQGSAREFKWEAKRKYWRLRLNLDGAMKQIGGKGRGFRWNRFGINQD